MSNLNHKCRYNFLSNFLINSQRFVRVKHSERRLFVIDGLSKVVILRENLGCVKSTRHLIFAKYYFLIVIFEVDESAIKLGL